MTSKTDNKTHTPPKTESAAKHAKKDAKVDRQMEDTFPASDPPSFSGGRGIIGAPPERESEAPRADSTLVKQAEKKVKSGDAKKPHTY